MGIATPTGVLWFDAYDKPLSTTGLAQPLSYRNFYLTGTTTPATVYQDGALTTPYAQPIVADANGRFSPIYLDPNVTYRAQLHNAANQLLEDVDPISPSSQVVTGSFTIGTTGFVANPSGTAQYAIFFGRIVQLFIPPLGPATSNATTFTLTGIPAVIQPANTMPHQLQVADTTDNSTEVIGDVDIPPQSSVFNMQKNGSNTGWTASGLKGFGVETLTYWLS